MCGTLDTSLFLRWNHRASKIRPGSAVGILCDLLAVLYEDGTSLLYCCCLDAFGIESSVNSTNKDEVANIKRRSENSRPDDSNAVVFDADTDDLPAVV